MLALYLSMCTTDEQRNKISYIYETYYTLMYRAVYSIVYDADVAPDIVHDAMIKLIRSNEPILLDNEPSLKSFLSTVAANTAKDYLRVRTKKTTADIEDLSGYLDKESAEPSAWDIMIGDISFYNLVQCIRTLPHTYKDVCYLKYVCELGDQEIADKLHVKYSTVAMRVHRGRKILQQRMTEVQRSEV